jgi:hypothetical protein
MTSKYKQQRKCQNIIKFLPSITPEIYGVSKNSSVAGVYTIINIYGLNFSLFGPTGYSNVNFGPYINLPVIFLGSQTLSFEIPTFAPAGSYSLSVVNMLNPNPLYSNSVSYTLTYTNPLFTHPFFSNSVYYDSGNTNIVSYNSNSASNTSNSLVYTSTS